MPETETLTLSDFLLARYAEAEAAAERASRHNAPGDYANDNYGCLLVGPARVLAECAALRQVVALHSGDAEWCGWTQGGDGTHGDMGFGPEPTPIDCETLQALATPYLEHPDYGRVELHP